MPKSLLESNVTKPFIHENGLKGKDALMASIHEMGKLAKEVENGTVTSAKELDDTFARAHYALARHYNMKANESWAKKAYKQVGYYLKGAARHINNAILWSGNKVESGFEETIKGIRILSEKLIDGAGWVADEVGKGMEFIEKEIEKLGKKIEPVKK